MEEKNKIVETLLLSKKSLLRFTAEDEQCILKLWQSYWKKRKGDVRSASEVLAAAILWQYSKLNGLWEEDKKWSLQNLAGLFSVKPKTVGSNSSEIARILKIALWDDRFCRKDIAESNPMKQMVMLESGMIIGRDYAINEGIPFAPLKKTKEDYYYDGCDLLDKGQDDKAIKCFKKALSINEQYVEAWNGLGTAYWLENLSKAKEYFQKAHDLTLQHFHGKFPKKLDWGVLENRQYLRSIQNIGLSLWREKNTDEAMKLFMSLLRLNPNDNQGARYLVAAIHAGIAWENMPDEDNEKMDKVFEEQNKIHKFF